MIRDDVAVFASTMTPEPALWNCRSRGFESGGASKKRRKKRIVQQRIASGLLFNGARVAMFTTEGETRLTMGQARAWLPHRLKPARRRKSGPLMTAAASAAAANLRRRFMQVLRGIFEPASKQGRTDSSGLLASIDAILH